MDKKISAIKRVNHCVEKIENAQRELMKISDEISDENLKMLIFGYVASIGAENIRFLKKLMKIVRKNCEDSAITIEFEKIMRKQFGEDAI